MQSVPLWIVTAVLALSTLFSTMLLWQTPALLVTVLFLAACAFMVHVREKRMVAVYVFGFLFGPVTEIASIYTGAWHYTAPFIFGIPLWLPFVWGCAALTIASLYKISSDRARDKK